MVKIPIGNGSKNGTLMVVYAFPRRGKEANAQNEHIFAAVGYAAGLGDNVLLMICGDLQHDTRRHSRNLDFALSQGWLADLGETHKPAGAAQPHAHRTLHWSTRPSARQWVTLRLYSGILYPNTKDSRSL